MTVNYLHINKIYSYKQYFVIYQYHIFPIQTNKSSFPLNKMLGHKYTKSIILLNYNSFLILYHFDVKFQISFQIMNIQKNNSKRFNQTYPTDIHIQNLFNFKQTTDPLNKKEKAKNQDINIIKYIRGVIKNMTEKRRFKKAKDHFYDALYNKKPKIQTFSELPESWMTTLLLIQASKAYEIFLYLLSFFYMYLVIADIEQNFIWLVITQGILLIIFWTDILLYNYGEVNQKIRIISKQQNRFYFKIFVFIALVVDYVIFLSFYQPNSRSIRIFSVLRAFLPIFYDAITRKNFYALISAVKDIFVFLIFYSLVIFGFAIIGNQFIVIQQGVVYDEYKQNYGSLGKFIFIMYVMSSYDSYPDNQLLAIEYQHYLYVFFIIFILLNTFVFINIPTTIISNSFKETRSKMIFFDQLKKQHSLILAFVSLGEEDLYLKNQKLIRFFLYLYKNKTQYLNNITQICLKLDQNNTGSIQVNEFMQILKIIQQKQSMIPPFFYDWDKWISFRKYINKNIKLNNFFKSWKTQAIIAGITIVVTAINLTFLYTEIYELHIFNLIITFVYLSEILLKIIAFGFQQFFADRWNSLDFYIIIISTILSMLYWGSDVLIPHNSDIIINMFRIYRFSYFLQFFTQKDDVTYSYSIINRIQNLVGQTTIIIPVVLKLFSLIIIFYYIMGIIGMQAFYTIYDIPASQSPYSSYDQFSNFRTFVGSQIVFMQILVEAGWSMIAFDHAYRSQGLDGIVIIYFVICHVIFVIILTSLFKGIVWEVYFAVDDQYEKGRAKQIQLSIQQTRMRQKKRQYEEINEKVNKKQLIHPTTIVKRQIIQNKIDMEIFKKIKNIYQKQQINKNNLFQDMNIHKDISKDRIMLVSHLIKEKQLSFNDFKKNEDENNQIQTQLQSLYQSIMANNAKQFSDLEFVQQVDFQEKMQDLLTKVILNPKIQYSQTIVYPKVFVQFLNERCKKIKDKALLIQFGLKENIFHNSQSMKIFTYQLKSLLEIRKSARLQKIMIAEHMINEGFLTQEEAKKQFQKQYKQDNYNIDVNYIMRKILRHSANQDLVQRIQLQYFSSIYGQKFRQINKIRLQPLLKYQSMLTYNFRNILRYDQIQNNTFFQILSTLQNCFSNKLLKKGSLFKFVFQLQNITDTWFTIQYSHQKEVIVHFLKTGIWVYHKSQESNQIYHARDIFNWDLSNSDQDQKCAKLMKLFFQSFQTIALSQIDQKTFFQTNPQDTVYDLFFFSKDTLIRQSKSQEKNTYLKISKIMLIILSRQQQRQTGEQLPYQLTDINQQQQKQNRKTKLNESLNEAFQQLKNMSALDQQKIMQNDGLPFAYIVNLMTQIKQTLQIHGETMVMQVQKTINQSFDLVLHQGNFNSEKLLKRKRSSKRIIF